MDICWLNIGIRSEQIQKDKCSSFAKKYFSCSVKLCRSHTCILPHTFAFFKTIAVIWVPMSRKAPFNPQAFCTLNFYLYLNIIQISLSTFWSHFSLRVVVEGFYSRCALFLYKKTFIYRQDFLSIGYSVEFIFLFLVWRFPKISGLWDVTANLPIFKLWANFNGYLPRVFRFFAFLHSYYLSFVLALCIGSSNILYVFSYSIPSFWAGRYDFWLLRLYALF